jgi:hypothetical protein
MDTKKTLIIFGSVAAVGAAFYFILKPSSAKAATPTKKNPKFPTGLEYPDGFPKSAKTKDCIVSTFNCVSTTKETIQIPLSANCMDYQPAMPQCANDTPPDYSFDDGYTYYSGYYAGYEPSGGLPYSGQYLVESGGLPYSGGRPPKGQYLVIRGYSDYAMKPKLGFPPSGRGSYGGYGVQMVERDSRRPAYV